MACEQGIEQSNAPPGNDSGFAAKNILATFYGGNESALAAISCVVSEFLQQSQND
jgi:hypothetical protein